jgi:hypothetical protein
MALLGGVIRPLACTPTYWVGTVLSPVEVNLKQAAADELPVGVNVRMPTPEAMVTPWARPEEPIWRRVVTVPPTVLTLMSLFHDALLEFAAAMLMLLD